VGLTQAQIEEAIGYHVLRAGLRVRTAVQRRQALNLNTPLDVRLSFLQSILPKRSTIISEALSVTGSCRTIPLRADRGGG